MAFACTCQSLAADDRGEVRVVRVAAPTFDLQAHSTFSDGALPPRAVVAAAADAGVALLALTDHDTVDGVDEALEASATLGLRLVPAGDVPRRPRHSGGAHGRSAA
jgi:hypothetical protein